MSREDGYKIRNKEGIHFVTFAVVEWVVVFTRKVYRDIVMDSLKYCMEFKGLVLYSWCLMSNHIHLVLSAKDNNTSGILRDFKKHTCKKLIEAIKNHPAVRDLQSRTNIGGFANRIRQSINNNVII
jgi:putative transposase